MGYRFTLDRLSQENEEAVIDEDIPVEEELATTESEVIDANEGAAFAVSVAETGEVMEQIETAETPEQAVEIAVEHLLKRIGHTGDYSSESFNELSDETSTYIEEKIVGRMGNAITRMVTTETKLKAQLEKALEKLQANGSKSTTIKDPGWSKYMICDSTAEANGKSVIAVASKLEKTLLGSGTKSFLTELTRVTSDILKIRKGSGIFINTHDAKKLGEVSDGIEKVLDKAEAITGASRKNTNYPNYEPLTYNEAVTLSKIALNLIDFNKTLDWNAFTKVYKEFKRAGIWKKVAREGVKLAAQTAVSIVTKGRSNAHFDDARDGREGRPSALYSHAVTSMFKNVTFAQRVGYAIVKYIEASSAS